MLPKWIRRIPLVIFLLLLGCAGLQEPPVDEVLAELDAQIAAGDYGQVNSLLIWHDGEMVLESYYRGTNQDTLNQVYSVTKSVTSAMIGVAMAEGQITTLDHSILDYFPEYEPLENPDVAKDSITLEDLLTMRAGFAWDELSSTYGAAENDVTSLTRSQDWVKYVLEGEMVAVPGETFAYNSGVTMLIGAILQEVTGETAEEYTAVHLFEPLGITEWRWQQTPAGRSNTGWGLFLRPVDMVKFGRLYLREGEWAGEQIVPAAWVTHSTQPFVHVNDETNYAFQWWRFADESSIVADLAENDVYFAWGFGGNFIFVVPHLDLVIVTSAENFENSSQIFPALRDYIFPAFD